MKVKTDTNLQKQYKKHVEKTKSMLGLIKRLIKDNTIDISDINHPEDYKVTFGSLTSPVYSPWESDWFDVFIADLDDKTLIPKRSLYNLYQLAMNCAELPGLFVELGTYKGGSAILLSKVTNQERIHCFDTFKGLIGSTEYDLMEDGEFSDTDLDSLKEILPRVNFHVGNLPSTLSEINGQIAFCHIDIDLYQPILNSLEKIYPMMTPGGIILFDDYGGWCTQGAKKAIDEFFSDKEEKPIVQMTGQAIVIKR